MRFTFPPPAFESRFEQLLFDKLASTIISTLIIVLYDDIKEQSYLMRRICKTNKKAAPKAAFFLQTGLRLVSV
jgi:hypothetical protein